MYRPRRMRATPALRCLIQETTLTPRQIMAPLFVTLSGKKKDPIPSMPGVFRLSISEAVKESRKLSKLGIGALLLFGIPARKDPRGSGAYAQGGVIQQAIKAIKEALFSEAAHSRRRPESGHPAKQGDPQSDRLLSHRGLPPLLITDVCLCEYTSHGHCGVLGGGPNRATLRSRAARSRTASSWVDNDATLELLGEIALSHAKAGADIVAPSAMMDGQVGAIREALDRSGFKQTPIMSYSAKYASGLYGPFREAVASAPQFGDRRGYQMDPPNAEEALREVALDIQEGADIVMVKPASLYLDVIRKVKEIFHWPTAAYQVSGEYSLIKAAAAKGWVEEKRVVLESAVAMRRAGADLIITYYAKELANWIRERGR